MLTQWLKRGRQVATGRPARTPPALAAPPPPAVAAAMPENPPVHRAPPREMAVEEWTPRRPLFALTEPEVRGALHHLRERAISDRLECAIPFLETLAGLLQNEAEKGTPPGILTVRGWMKLISQWEFLAKHLKNRQLRYLLSFLEELEADPNLPCREVLEPVLTELHGLFDDRAADTMVEAVSSSQEKSSGERRAA